MPQISVVLPVYNVEEYLRQCLDSLANQTFEDFEVICVNDGSGDSSLSILEEYASEDERFKIISQENKGLSGARNTGMDHIKGKYTIFVDSDDWLELNALEKLYNKITALDSDILMYKFRFFNQDSEQYSESVFTNLEVIDASLENKNFNYRDVSNILFKISHKAILRQLIIIIPARGYRTTVASVQIFKVVQMYIQFPLLKDKPTRCILKIPCET